MTDTTNPPSAASTASEVAEEAKGAADEVRS